MAINFIHLSCAYELKIDSLNQERLHHALLNCLISQNSYNVAFLPDDSTQHTNRIVCLWPECSFHAVLTFAKGSSCPRQRLNFPLTLPNEVTYQSQSEETERLSLVWPIADPCYAVAETV